MAFTALSVQLEAVSDKGSCPNEDYLTFISVFIL
jgi:hypothetical protein